jgi:hypothetical protein
VDITFVGGYCLGRRINKLYKITVELTNSVAPEPEGSSPHSQQPSNGPYPEPGESIQHIPSQSKNYSPEIIKSYIPQTNDFQQNNSIQLVMTPWHSTMTKHPHFSSRAANRWKKHYSYPPFSYIFIANAPFRDKLYSIFFFLSNNCLIFGHARVLACGLTVHKKKEMTQNYLMLLKSFFTWQYLLRHSSYIDFQRRIQIEKSYFGKDY